jgi:hypothetical protein
MRDKRAFIELHDGDDMVLIDVDEIHAIVGEANSTVYFAEYQEGFTVDEPPHEVVRLMQDIYVRAHAPGQLAREAISDFDTAMGYPR